MKFSLKQSIVYFYDIQELTFTCFISNLVFLALKEKICHLLEQQYKVKIILAVIVNKSLKHLLFVKILRTTLVSFL